MFGFLGKLFGTDKATASIVDNISSGLDKIWHTDQEVAEAKAKAITEGHQVYIEWLKSTSGSRLARRFIAITVMSVWVLQYLVVLVLGSVIPWLDTPSTVEAIQQTIVSLQTNGEMMTNSALIILSFYFLGSKGDSLIEGVVERIKNPSTKK